MKKAGIIAAALSAGIIVGCATDDPNKRTKIGAVVGAVAGGVIGNQSSSKNGKVAGAVVGALAGAAVWNYMDKQQQQLERQLAAEQAGNEVRVVRIDEETLKLQLNSEVTFAVNSSGIKSSFRGTLNKVAGVIGQYEQTAVHVIGHTDSTGGLSMNQQLSEQRASAVTSYLRSGGVQESRLRMLGRGELNPIATNNTAAGRSANRRVEIYLKPIVKGRENEAYRAPDVKAY